MPSIRVTIASNAKQSSKAPLLIPLSASYDPSCHPSIYSTVIKTAQSKLRLKKASRVFVQGGRELKNQDDWTDVLRDDLTLLVSTGEEYVGSRDVLNDGRQSDNVTALDCSVEILADKAFVDSTSITQLETTARTLPGIIHTVAQPDLHPGTKFPIGAVFVSKGWIHPPLIGSDIGCGMAWYKTCLSASQVEGDKGRKIAEKLRGLEGPWRDQHSREIWLTQGDDDINLSAGEAWDSSLGTIGAGNHFAELQVVEKCIADGSGGEAQSTQLYEGEVVLLVHSGSRGYGGDILKRHTEQGKNSIREEDAAPYLQEHDRACGWASKNRDLIALRFFALLEPGDHSWNLGVNTTGAASPQEVSAAWSAVQSRKVMDMYHNNVEKANWPPGQTLQSTQEVGFNSRSLGEAAQSNAVHIHRKGAAPTHNPKTGTPLLILPLPGSRATPTLILHPTFGPNNGFGHKNALSLAHGAGRALSRAKAATYVAEKYAGRAEDLLRGDFVRSNKYGNKKIEEEDAQGRDINGGTWVVCEDKQLIWEEAGEAYKNVWDVGSDLVKKYCAEEWGWCRGRVSYKVRKE